MSLTTLIAGMADDSIFAANKNAIINGNFDIWQRGTSGFTTSGYTADRWRVTPGGGVTFSVARQTNTLGDGQSEFALRWDQTVAGSTVSLLEQRIEGVQTFNGQTITVSVDTEEISGTAPTVQFRIQQNFGTGGSPSSAVFSSATAITVDSTRTRRSATFTLASISGKTLGSNDNDYLSVQLLIGNAIFTMDLNECQIEVGSVATTFERRSFATELAMAQRYYAKTFPPDVVPASAAGRDSTIGYRIDRSGTATDGAMWSFPVTMRAPPTISLFNPINAGSNWHNANLSANSGTSSAIRRGVDTAFLNNSQVGGDSVGLFVEINATADAEL